VIDELLTPLGCQPAYQDVQDGDGDQFTQSLHGPTDRSRPALQWRLTHLLRENGLGEVEPREGEVIPREALAPGGQLVPEPRQYFLGIEPAVEVP